MSIEVRCEHCGKTMRMQDSLSGTRGRCPLCQNVIDVPQATVVASAERVKKVDSPPAELPASPACVDASPVNASNDEATIYSDSDVTVTTARVLCAGATYALRNITSVKMGETPPNIIPTLLAIVIGICALVTALSRFEFNPAVVFLFVVGIALIAIGVKHVNQLTSDYHLFVSSSSGEVRAFTSKDRQQVERIVSGVNEAIGRYP